MRDDFFKISVIDGAITLRKHYLCQTDKNITDIIRYLKIGPATLSNYDYDRAQSLIEKNGWDIVSIEGTRREQLQATLKHLVLIYKPFWAKISYMGRENVKHFINDDAMQCLKYAGLFDDYLDVNVLKWWEDISNYFRVEDENVKIQIGKIGELRTLKLETERLERMDILKSPMWISIEDSTAGFDVLSYRCGSHEIPVQIKIEVKTCVYSPTHFFLTRNEWVTALKDSKNYLFHVWNLEKDQLYELSVEDIAVHIPNDNGLGEWKNVLINLHE